MTQAIDEDVAVAIGYVVGKRMNVLAENTLKARANLRDAKKLGGHSCYAAGYEAGLLEAYGEELVFLTSFLTGKVDDE
jgi:hypothetical protein